MVNTSNNNRQIQIPAAEQNQGVETGELSRVKIPDTQIILHSPQIGKSLTTGCSRYQGQGPGELNYDALICPKPGKTVVDVSNDPSLNSIKNTREQVDPLGDSITTLAATMKIKVSEAADRALNSFMSDNMGPLVEGKRLTAEIKLVRERLSSLEYNPNSPDERSVDVARESELSRELEPIRWELERKAEMLIRGLLDNSSPNAQQEVKSSGTNYPHHRALVSYILSDTFDSKTIATYLSAVIDPQQNAQTFSAAMLKCDPRDGTEKLLSCLEKNSASNEN